MAQQLALDLGNAPVPRLENFIGHPEIIMALNHLFNDLLNEKLTDSRLKNIYLSGMHGCGKSHLLAASCTTVQRLGGISCSLGAHSLVRDFVYSPEVTLYTVDDVDQLSHISQIALFNLFNQIQPHQSLICTGIEVPLGLHIREDLRTRLAWGLVFHLTFLNDEQKVFAFIQAAQERGLSLSTEIPNWLIKHYRRDLNSMMGLLDALDQFSLEKKRAITLPLMRELLTNL